MLPQTLHRCVSFSFAIYTRSSLPLDCLRSTLQRTVHCRNKNKFPLRIGIKKPKMNSRPPHSKPNQRPARPPVSRPSAKLRGHPKDSDDVRISKTLSWVLRHGAKSEGLFMREDGYVKVADLVSSNEGVPNHYLCLTLFYCLTSSRCLK